jgi:hypothetical protein
LEGGIAPFVTTDFKSIQPYAGLIKQKVIAKEMPPWLANDGCSDYLGDRSLTDAEIATMSKWVDDGAVEGDPAEEGKPIDVGFQPKLTRVDKTLGIGTKYTMDKTPDDYHCFVIDWNETATKYVSGFRANPGNAQIVHHVIAFLATPNDVDKIQALDDAEAGPGYTCFGGPGINTSEWLGAWAPGSAGTDYQPGTGIKVPPGSKVVLQVHYNSLTAGVQSDEKTNVEFKIDDKVDHEAHIQPWTNPQWLGSKQMKIAAMDPDAKHSFAYDATVLSGGKSFTVYSGGLHMHQLGTHATLSIERQGGASECMLQIDKWNFHWQGSYPFVQPKVFNPGDKMSVECHWDNTPPMQPTIDGQKQVPKDVYWGEGTTDEMCLGTFYMVPN